MLKQLNYTRLEHTREGLAAEYSISAPDSDGGELTIVLADLGGGKLAPQIRCFSDQLGALADFLLWGAAKVLDGEYETPEGFEQALQQIGIWA
jgi:hypothetical protein